MIIFAKIFFMKNLFLFSIFILFSTVLIGQQFKGGINLGLMGTQVTGDDLAGFNKAGIKAGGFVSMALNDKSSLQMELNFIQKGSRKNPDSLDYSTYLMRTNYVEIPVHYKYYWNKYAITFEGGASIAALVYSLELRNGVDDMPVAFNRFDYSWEIGIFYQLWERTAINVRYSYSILAMRPHYLGQSTWRNHGQYHETLGISLYYQL